jgi:hypothetical protein
MRSEKHQNTHTEHRRTSRSTPPRSAHPGRHVTGRPGGSKWASVTVDHLHSVYFACILRGYECSFGSVGAARARAEPRV